MAAEYLELFYQHRKGSCSTTFLSNRDFAWSLSTGQSVAESWPADMSLSMNPERAKDVALSDYIHNLEGLLVASPRMVDFFTEQNLPNLEFLPVSILDHKGRVASDAYKIIHCCNVVDCVDQDQSDFQWDGLSEPSMVVERVVIKEDALDGDARMITPKFVPGKVFYRVDFAEAIDAEGFSCVTFLSDLFD
jgi:hypothetical protein